MGRINPSEIKDMIQQNPESRELVNLLVTIVEGSESIETRLELLEFLSLYDLRNESYFALFENLLISDAQEKIRALAADIIVHNYIEEGFGALEWAILNDSSPLVLRKVYNLVKETTNPVKIILEAKIYEKFENIAQKYKIAVKEVPFLMDLGLNFSNRNFYIGNQDFHFIYENDKLCIIKEGHIKELGISFIREVPESIGQLKKLEHLDLSFGYISNLPGSIVQLKKLNSINLSWNNLTLIPKVIESLLFVDQINLSHNEIKFWPRWALEQKNIII
ncbi:MAG: leucine-rich repeat domain-containing protein [Promethearchaeota archaeon]|nr:MAG: leucine-rich repeat domain-containing protein [Candidatus Lokiarchaeota archaeon]